MWSKVRGGASAVRHGRGPRQARVTRGAMRTRCELPLTPPGGPVLAGWCHGNAGYVFLWNLARTVYQQESFAELAERAAWLTDCTNQVTSLCCGTGRPGVCRAQPVQEQRRAKMAVSGGQDRDSGRTRGHARGRRNQRPQPLQTARRLGAAGHRLRATVLGRDAVVRTRNIGNAVRKLGWGCPMRCACLTCMFGIDQPFRCLCRGSFTRRSWV
jgi:hypothetical protein